MSFYRKRLPLQKFFEMLNIAEILTCFTVLFAVIDMPGNIPIIVSLRNKIGHIQSEKATIVAGVLLVSFLFIGNEILRLIGIDVNSFAVAGSIVLFLIALELILGIEIHKDETPQTASIVPIAFPIIVGAGSLTTVLSLKSQYEMVNIVIAILLNLIIVYLILKNAGRIGKFLGSGGISVLKKVFGVILLAIAIKLFTTNIYELFQSNIQF